MIDICIVVHKNYDLLKLQIKHWNWVKGNKRLLICDNTPDEHKKKLFFRDSKIQVYDEKFPAFDGQSHGMALDFLATKCESDIIGICDTDFFWLQDDILSTVQSLFQQGHKCVGVELWYDDFEKVNKMFPERAGYLAPCVFGMFIDRQLAQSNTFSCTPQEGHLIKAEVGWRVRTKIINEKIPCCVFKPLPIRNPTDSKITYFGHEQKPIGVHLLKGSGLLMYRTTVDFVNKAISHIGGVSWINEFKIFI